MESKLWTLVCFLYLTRVISSLPRTDDQTILQNNVPFKISSHTSYEPTVKNVIIKYDEDWKTVPSIKDSDKPSDTKIPKDGSVKDMGKSETATNGPIESQRKSDELIELFEGIGNNEKTIPFYNDNKNNVNNAFAAQVPSYLKNDQEIRETKNENDDERFKEVIDRDSRLKDGEELFDIEDLPSKPNIATNQAFIPLSPNIKEGDLMKFLTEEDVKSTPFSYRHFQLASPVKEMDVVKTTEASSGESKMKANNTTSERRQEEG